MLSRVADTIYWLARYAERTQAMLQVIRTGYIASQNELSEYSWAPLLHRYGDLGADEVAALAGRTQPALHHLVLDKGNGASAYTNILRGRENARAVQDHISKEVWQALNDYYHAMRSPEVRQQLAAGDPISGIDLLLRNSLIFTGAVKNTMARGEGYVYLHLGKYLERALQTADTLRNRWAAIAHDAHHPLESAGLRYLLYSLFGYEQYMKTYKGNFNPANVLHLALYSRSFRTRCSTACSSCTSISGACRPPACPRATPAWSSCWAAPWATCATPPSPAKTPTPYLPSSTNSAGSCWQ